MEEARDQERLAEHMEAGMALGEVKKQLVDALQAHLTRKHKKGVIKNMVHPPPPTSLLGALFLGPSSVRPAFTPRILVGRLMRRSRSR